MAEDAYQGDAQFTVSMDGVQLGGTFTTTALQSTGVTQSFIFNGNWAAGAHTVTVTFLNDAYGGSSSTDRNLYVDGVTYDGTNTGQSGALYSDGLKTFLVNDTTASPSTTTTSAGTSSSGNQASFIGGTHDAAILTNNDRATPAIGLDDVFGSILGSGDSIDLRPPVNATASNGSLSNTTPANGNVGVAIDQHDTGVLSFGDLLSHAVGS
jgi:hypothetical protein